MNEDEDKEKVNIDEAMAEAQGLEALVGSTAKLFKAFRKEGLSESEASLLTFDLIDRSAKAYTNTIDQEL